MSDWRIEAAQAANEFLDLLSLAHSRSPPGREELRTTFRRLQIALCNGGIEPLPSGAVQIRPREEQRAFAERAALEIVRAGRVFGPAETAHEAWQLADEMEEEHFQRLSSSAAKMGAIFDLVAKAIRRNYETSNPVGVDPRIRDALISATRAIQHDLERAFGCYPDFYLKEFRARCEP